MPSQEDSSKDLSAYEWVKNYLRVTYNKPGLAYAGLPHRIDRPTGGILLLTKTSKSAARMSEAFQLNQVKKTYYCVTENPPALPSGKLVNHLVKIAEKNIVRAYNKPIHGSKYAELDYEVLDSDEEGKTLIKVHPITGRQHQIRVQMTTIGCVICGDVKYGKTTFLPEQAIALLAKEIAFTHPVRKEKMVITVPTPLIHVWKPFHDKGY